uniref:Uncharacterized protein n=1 Tax=Zea mays TaxID=4577 RepID=C4J5V8_MAIZE|nr:unknown [Zea mays]
MGRDRAGRRGFEERVVGVVHRGRRHGRWRGPGREERRCLGAMQQLTEAAAPAPAPASPSVLGLEVLPGLLLDGEQQPRGPDDAAEPHQLRLHRLAVVVVVVAD